MISDQKNKKPVAAVFVDGSNLYHAAKEAFGFVRHDVAALARMICEKKGWDCGAINFYSGTPTKEHDPLGFDRWDKRIAVMKQQGINVVTRPLTYRAKKIFGPNGEENVSLHTGEKGIDVRIALDMVRAAYEKTADVFVVFSQDQDLREACMEVKRIKEDQKNSVRICSAFPLSDKSPNARGIRDVEKISIDLETYNQCLDGRSYHRSKEQLLAYQPKPKVEKIILSARDEFDANQKKHAAQAKSFVNKVKAPSVTATHARPTLLPH